MPEQSKRYKGFSILELLVSMGIVAIVMVMMSNVLINSIVVARKVAARSKVREEIGIVADRITSDIRAASKIIECGGEMDEARCELVVNAQRVVWQLCDGGADGDYLCRLINGVDLDFTTGKQILINNFSFEETSNTNDRARQTILFTVVASHANENYDVNNIARQTAVATRNYIYEKSN